MASLSVTVTFDTGKSMTDTLDYTYTISEEDA